MPRPVLRQRPTSWWAFLLASLPLAGGAGLAVHILAGISLPLAAGVIVLFGVGVWLLLLPRLRPRVRRQVGVRVGVGALSGAVATVAYDLARYGAASIFSLSFQPFHVIRLFGELFLGSGAPVGAAVAVGFLYHLSNGVCFGIVYALVFWRPGALTGIAWGIALELCMALLYPAWLRIAVLQEFLAVSAAGHVIYGAVLGVLARRLLDRRAQLDSAPSGGHHG
ncbi:hypothetical protein OU415_15285 [Saccharopolyspora sp. WRP15-2]|uniref:Uncharacterized protein n=1 Tax=Saccharopolyspora oryzae TaxID=2997343 RepID=A0ABT4V0H0_9PSEU|nr:hypothetical protein [Saccharopolyspora oryzae]MDA3626807.1 hypothetical protein [Saccharopolyspora oryzae]